MLAVLLPLLAGCGGRSAEGEVVVFAAASLTDVFAAMQEGFNQERPDVTVTYNFANSAALATQINEGAPADVFASAGQTQTDAVAAAAGATTLHRQPAGDRRRTRQPARHPEPGGPRALGHHAGAGGRGGPGRSVRA